VDEIVSSLGRAIFKACESAKWVSMRDQYPKPCRCPHRTSAGCAGVFIDEASRKLFSRPELDATLRGFSEGDQLVVTMSGPAQPFWRMP
jgi:hypothetical protein